jgi:hypothetical protein
MQLNIKGMSIICSTDCFVALALYGFEALLGDSQWRPAEVTRNDDRRRRCAMASRQKRPSLRVKRSNLCLEDHAAETSKARR